MTHFMASSVLSRAHPFLKVEGHMPPPPNGNAACGTYHAHHF